MCADRLFKIIRGHTEVFLLCQKTYDSLINLHNPDPNFMTLREKIMQKLSIRIISQKKQFEGRVNYDMQIINVNCTICI